MSTPNEALRALAQTFRAMPPDKYDHWRALAGSLERYAEGKEDFADLFRVRRHRLDINEQVSSVADRLKVAEWLRTLKEPRRMSATPRESSAV
jgi:hypothetical protein